MMGSTSIYNNDNSGTQCGGFPYDATVTFTQTYHNEPDGKEDEAERLAEIERLEAMMHDRGCHEVSKHVRQVKEVKHARLAPMKHKKPHMNRKVIR